MGGQPIEDVRLCMAVLDSCEDSFHSDGPKGVSWFMGHLANFVGGFFIEGQEVGLVDLLVASGDKSRPALRGIAPSRREAKNLIQGGAVSVNNAKITDPKAKITDNFIVLRVGKNRMRFFLMVEDCRVLDTEESFEAWMVNKLGAQ